MLIGKMAELNQSELSFSDDDFVEIVEDDV